MRHIYIYILFLFPLFLLGRASVYASDLELVLLEADSVRCHGESNGRIRIEVTGGSPPYYYSYSGPVGSGSISTNNTSHVFTGLQAGFYNVSVIDNEFRGISDFIFVHQPDPLVTDVTPKPATMCAGNILQFDGNPSGGNLSYTHLWSGTGVIYLNADDIVDPVFTVDVIGSYDLNYRVEDQYGCWAAEDITVEVYSDLAADVSKTDITCSGAVDGTITVSGATGGSAGNFEYSADDGLSWQSAAEFTGLPAGTYHVWLRDADVTACEVFLETVVINEPAELQGSVSFTVITCHGADDGSITVSGVSGGWGNYQFSIDDGSTWQSGAFFGALGAGAYQVWMRDADFTDCEKFLDEITLTEPDELTADVDKVDVTECHGNTNGEISISDAAGGYGNYEFSIDGGASWQVSVLFEGLGAGSYQVWMRDSDFPDCGMFLAEVTLTEPDELDGSVSSTPITCNGADDGSITVSGATGGSGNYEFSNDNGTTWQSETVFTDLTPGTYRVWMRDEEHPGCMMFLDEITLTEPAELQGSVSSTVITCNGADDGSITVSGATGGSGDYEFSIDDGVDWQSDASFGGLGAATYQVWMRDANFPACEIFLEAVTLTEPDELTADVDKVDVTEC
ncbi:MAG: hypothetical protein EA408_12295, partial [Marinilabiliales bacterium]